MKVNIIHFLIFAVFFLVPLKEAHSECSKQWHDKKSPTVITTNDAIRHMIWNDPSVIKEGKQYTMFLSGGSYKEFPNPTVSIYRATSLDGIKWNINAKPIIAPGKKNDWDNHRIETPSVVHVNGVYHLYYSGCQKQECIQGQYHIGHATSQNGIDWIKDKNNPIIRYQMDQPLKWGFYSVAEPGVVYNTKDQTFYLYYMSAKARIEYAGDEDRHSIHGILLATSKDGSHFTDKGIVLTQSPHYSIKDYFIGYSTPSALIDQKGHFHLFYDVIHRKKNDWNQRAFARSISRDGINFKEIEHDIITINDIPWATYEINGPNALIENGQFRMWFAGRTKNWKKQGGIGLLEKCFE